MEAGGEWGLLSACKQSHGVALSVWSEGAELGGQDGRQGRDQESRGGSSDRPGSGRGGRQRVLVYSGGEWTGSPDGLGVGCEGRGGSIQNNCWVLGLSKG